jgi:hypothetical protein
MDELLLYQKRIRQREQKIETHLLEEGQRMWVELPFGIFMKMYEIDGVKHRFTMDTTNGKRGPIEKLVGNQWKRI